MNAEKSLQLARRFIELPQDKRRLFLASLDKEGIDFSQFPIPEGVVVDDRDALSYAQQRMWVLWQLDPQGGAYNLPGAVRLRGALNLQALEQAFATLLARHQALSTVFERRADDQLRQRYRPGAPAIAHTDLAGLPGAEQEQQVQEQVLAESLRPFDLEHGPLLRIRLLRLGEQEHVLLLTLHHIVSDGWSMNVLIDEFSRCYDSFAAGQAPNLPSLPIQYADYALWQRRWLEAGELERQLGYWQAQLGEEQPVLELPLDHPRPATPSLAGSRLELAVEAGLAEQLRGFARQHNLTLFMVLLGAFGLLLQRHTGQHDLRIGSPVANRNRAEVEGLIGLFVNTQVLRLQPDDQLDVSSYLQAVRQTVLGAQAHQDLPFERLVDALKVERSLSHAPLFQVMYNHQPQVADLGAVTLASGLELQPLQWRSRTTQFDLSLDTFEQGGTLRAAFTFATDLFEPATIERMAGHWLTLLRGLVEEPGRALWQLPMLDAASRRQVLQEWNATDTPYPLEQPVHQLFEAQMRQNPDAPALVFEDTTLSYAELDAQANRLAHYLRGRGVASDGLVGVAAQRSVEMVVALLAIHKAGAAYVPLDPEYPAERLAYMIEDSGIALLLTQQALQASLPLPPEVQCVALDTLALDEQPATPPAGDITPSQLAYVIYTSGSTGRPKGAGNSHAALANRLHWMQQAYALGAQDRVLQKTPFSFDVSVWEFFWPLMTGACLVMATPGEHRDPARLIARIRRHGVTTLHFVPSMLQAFIHEPGVETCDSLVRIVCSGEALPVDAQRQVFARLPAAGLYNLYGPTEAAIDVTHWTCVEEGRDSVPIGRPIANIRTYVLDAGLEPVAPGVSGELYLAGIGLARGYHRRPGLSAERFVADPFTPGGRLYRTGDRVRQRSDGVIEYLGRFDHQVKIRGLRIELGEIEARLAEHDSVREAVVLARDGRQLVAYLVLDAQPEGWQQGLKDWLLQSLPEFMVPTHLLVLDSLPLTPNGKLDRKALPLPDSAAQPAYQAPQDARQASLAQVWSDVLGVAQVGLDDNFFELGGDSIIAIQVVSRARKVGLQLNPRDLFQYQTVRSLAQAAGQLRHIEAEQGQVQGQALLTPVQVAFFEQALGVPGHWNQSLLLAPRQALDPERLAQALERLVAQHDALRLRFNRPDGHWQAWHQGSDGAATFSQAQADNDAALQAICEATQRELDLADGPLLRAVLVQHAGGGQYLLLVIHHLVVDGVSWRVLLEDLQLAYQQQPLAAKSTSWQAWAGRLPALAQAHAGELDYWRGQSGAAELPCDNPAGAMRNRDGRTLKARLDSEATRRLLQVAPAAYRTQVNDLLLTALAQVVTRWSGQASMHVQLEGHGREAVFDDVDLSRTVGWFTTLFPLNLTPARHPGEAIKAVKEQLRAVPGKGLGYGLLRHLGDAAQRQALAALPEPRITFNYLGRFDQQFDADALWQPATQGSGTAQDPDAPLANWLTVEGQVYAGELSLQIGYSSQMYQHDTVARLLEEYVAQLHALIEHCCQLPAPQATPSDFPLAAVDQASLDALALPLADISDLYALSPMQQGMLFHSLADQAAGSYINQLVVGVEGIEPERFRAAWQACVDAHDILRSGLLWQDPLEQPVQVVYHQAQLPFCSLDWREQADPEAALAALAAEERLRGFDLHRAPLLRLVLVRLGEHDYRLIQTHHHVLMDGWSNAQLLAEVLQRYQGLAPVAGATRYRDYIQWLHAQDATTSEAFWRERLATLPGPTRLAQALPQDAAGEGFEDCAVQLDAACLARLQRLAREQKVTLNTVVQAAWLLLLQRYTGQSTVCFGATVAGRPAQLPGVEQQIGLFINTLPVIASVAGDVVVGDWLRQVQAHNLALRDHEHTPLAELQRWAGHPGEALFDTLVVFDNYPVADALSQADAGLRFSGLQHHEHTHYPLTLEVGQGAGLSLRLSYDRASFDAPRVAALAAHLEQLLDAFCAAPTQALGNLALLQSGEHRQVVESWNATARQYPTQYSVQQLIEAQVARTPHADALLFGERRLSYGELDAQANQLAHCLREQGVGPDVLVGIAAERSIEMVVGLLAILKAGGAYVPLDPEYPRERLAYLFEDSAMALLLSQSHLALPVPAGVPVLHLDRLDLAGYPVQRPEVTVAGEHLAYVIYTSGSTGQPKGAGNRHVALLNRLCWMQQAYALDASDTVLQKTPFSFDVSVWEFFWPLMTGARLAIAGPGDHRDPARLVALVQQHQVTTLHFVPSMLQAFLTDEQVQACVGITRIICSGEALQADTQQQVFARLPGAALYNLYGPTEAAIDVTHWTCREEGSDTVPIGQPIANLATYVLDADLNPLPAGVTGELYLGGEGLARGYHRRAALTAERFVTSPFGGGARLYRTGDLARQRADGVIEYAGRIDHQVKIRGLRIELGEIEARLLEQPEVREAVVVALDQQLVGYVTGAVQADILRERLRAVLPEHMLPAQLLVLEHMPLSPNGKLDRKALPRPDVSANQASYVAPVTPVEQHLAQIWQQVLKLERVGLHDNFFELGGDSIISIQMVSRARRLGIQLSPNDLFRHPTVAALAAVAGQGAQAVISQGPVHGEQLLLPAMHGFFGQVTVERGRWNQSLVLDVHQPLDGDVLGQALHALVTHHDALRLQFNGQQAHYGEPAAGTDLLWQHCLDDEAQWSALADAAQGSLDLAQGPLLRALLATVGGRQRLLLVVHHLVIDGVSWRVLLEDLQGLYRDLQAGRPAALPAKTHSLQDWGRALQAQVAHTATAQLARWQQLLAGASPAWPCPQPQGSRQRRHLGVARASLAEPLTRQLLQQAPAAYRTRINDLLLTALARVLTAWSGADELLVQLEGHGREVEGVALDLTRTLGWFTAFYPVRLAPAAGIGESIKAIKEQLRAVPGNGSGFGLLRHLGDAPTQAALAALPQPAVTFNYLGQFDTDIAGAQPLFTLAGHDSGLEQSLDAELPGEWSIDAKVEGGQLSLVWTFSQARYPVAQMQALADTYIAELGELVRHCCLPEQGSATPADFPLAGLDQAQLDDLPVRLAEVHDIYPLSPMQQGMLLHSLFDSGRGDYINQVRLDVSGLDQARFIQAWQACLQAHEILRSGFLWTAQSAQPLQLVYRQAQLPVTRSDLQGQAAQAFDALAEAERRQGFAPLEAPLLRLHIAERGAGQQHLVLTYHHALLDGWSTSQLLGEVLQRYSGLQPSAPAGRYRDYIAWLGAQPAGASEAFWREQLAGLQGPTRLVDALGGGSGEAGGGQHDLQLQLDSATSEALQRLARDHRVTLNTLLQLAWALQLQRLTGSVQVTFGATVSGRPASLPGVEQQVGLFINTLPLVCAPRAEQPLGEALAQLQASNARLRDFEYAALSDIQRWAGLPGEPLFDHILVFENYPVAKALREGTPDGLHFDNLQAPEQTNYPLTVLVTQDPGLVVTLRYASEHFSEQAMRALRDGLAQLLHGLLAAPQARIGELLAVGNRALGEQLARWNATAQDFPLDRPVHHWIEAQPADAVALLYGEQTLTYGELDARANRLAHGLIGQGVGPETLVGVAAERSLELVIALLAVLKTGAAYVPLDPDYPSQRLAYMLEDSAVRCLLAPRELALELPEEVARLDIAGDWSAFPATRPQVEIAPQSLAYMIYTSGSTGQPKGAGNRHSALTNRLCWMQQAYGLGRDDTVLQKTPFSFDVSVWEFFWPLMVGARLAIAAPGDHRDPARLVALIERHQVSTLHFVPSMLQVFLLDDGVGRCSSLRRIICSGEALAIQTQRQCLAQLPQARLYNLYGPTEAAIDVTHWTCREEGLDLVPIGEPISNVSTYVLDADLQPLAPGVIGELYLGGAGLARGYHRRPALTAERFVTSPFGTGERLYRTGDLACYRPDGVIEYAGRIDHQVKIRGLRVELGEIEARLMEQDQVREAVVIAIDQQLVAYVTGNPALEPLREALRGVLPEHMVPARIVVLERLPLSPNGKLDRKALPSPQAQAAPSRAPHSELQLQVAALWGEVLGCEQVGLDDNFFEQGGHSLLATRLVMGLRQQLALDIPLDALFASASLEAFCTRLEQLRAGSAPIVDELAKSLEALKRLSAEELENLIH
ncbi:non-ribosomal peptide synthase/polyketide synthase [Pseudomonas xanthosomatis]|uniref:non-ribosomal peptide synthase/polyketide synthase n=1 Tax=Pseudomonas xanthosomatis TaxID=2842356 RepID=UPI001C3E81E2|nr:non-ribosomal peptide synthase/polyketide synthase [Pseudomonas xanthosomatis]QXH44121.1 non-ribosomal peptide synthase/polyketide synthase [Pseudomonas xanthosomatis]